MPPLPDPVATGAVGQKNGRLGAEDVIGVGNTPLRPQISAGPVCSALVSGLREVDVRTRSWVGLQPRPDRSIR